MIVFSSFCGGGQPAIDVPARTNYNLRGHRSEVSCADHVVVVVDGDGWRFYYFTVSLFHCFIVLLLVVILLCLHANGVVGGDGKDEETLDERGNCFEI